MKTFIKDVCIVFAAGLLMTACTSIKPQVATVVAPKIPDETVISPDLKTFLATHPKLAVALRIPAATKSITEAQQEDKNSVDKNYVYSALEKELMNAGFTVIDRASVESVLSNKDNVIDYAQVAQKTHVDLFIEIQDLQLDAPFYQSEYKIKGTGQRYRSESKPFNTTYAVLSFKLVIVEKGSVGGLFTLYKQTCLNETDIQVLLRDGYPTRYRFGYEPENMWYSKLTWAYGLANSREAIATHFAGLVINILKNR
ncbi:MAG: hypothetical protein LBS16_07280 [Prevotellaceae bacterium]|jgi:hypothetical protein|nr:hypothetical protein [Prevotellaceae bacterium]